MEFTLTDKKILDATADTAALFMHENAPVRDSALPFGALRDFTGKEGQLCMVYSDKKGQPKRLLLVGIGKKEKFHLNKLRMAVAGSVNYCRQLGVEEMAFPAAAEWLKEEEAVVAIAESAVMAGHKFDTFKTEKVAPKLREIKISAKGKGLQRHLEYGLVVANSCCAARDLVNMPASTATPAYIAEQAAKLSKGRLKCTVYGKKELEKMGANALLAVASGSLQEPKMVVLEYNPASQKKLKTVALVGKGITFDSGGLSLKPAAAMETMKMDMSGAVAVLYTLLSAAELKLNVRIIGIMALTENLIGPSAYKPGDIIKTMSGKTIEVLNTDAEGRVVLSDALHMAGKFNPDYTIDIATLTGACIVALGQEASGVMGNDAWLIEALKRSGEATYERVWELPFYEEYEELIKSDFADVKNVVSNAPSPSGAGAITGGKFLQHFAKGRWAHLDIAGTGWMESEKGYKPKGATGVGVRLLTHFLSRL